MFTANIEGHARNQGLLLLAPLSASSTTWSQPGEHQGSALTAKVLLVGPTWA